MTSSAKQPPQATTTLERNDMKLGRLNQGKIR